MGDLAANENHRGRRAERPGLSTVQKRRLLDAIEGLARSQTVVEEAHEQLLSAIRVLLEIQREEPLPEEVTRIGLELLEAVDTLLPAVEALRRRRHSYRFLLNS